jgi:hypothetical protein
MVGKNISTTLYILICVDNIFRPWNNDIIGKKVLMVRFFAVLLAFDGTYLVK